MGSSTYQPNLGFSTEELVDSDWTGNITVSLTSWSLPTDANFALYTTNLAGTSVVDRIFSTFNVSNTDFSNSFPIVPVDHLHFQWGFTDLGTYSFDITWSGTHATDGAISTTETFVVEVVPEPSTALLLGAGSLALWMVARRKRALRNAA